MSKVSLIKQTSSVLLVMMFITSFFSSFVVPMKTEAASIFTCYSLNDTELIKIASLCQQEQGTAKGAAAEASLMANLYEEKGYKSYSTLYDYVRKSGWWASAATHMDKMNATSSVIAEVRSVLIDGKRTIPGYVDEHDYIGDITSCSNNGVSFSKNDKSQYIQFTTIIKNSMGATYTYYCHPDTSSDPFGYTSESRRKSIGERYYDFYTKELIGNPPPPPPTSSCTCDGSYAGNYVVTTSGSNLNIRDGESDSGTILGKIPNGTTVYVSKGNGSWLYVENYNGVSGHVSASYMKKVGSQLATPTISTNKSSYIVGDTVNVSWAASPSDSNLSHYWLNVIAPDGTWIHGGTMNKETSYSFIVQQTGNYTVTTYATPIGSKEGEGSLTDTKTITVSEVIPKGKELASGAGQTLPDGDYYIFSAIDRNYYLDVDGRECPAANGTNVGMYISATGYPNEYDAWTIKYLGNGVYQIKQKSTNMCLDVSDASLNRGTNVQAWVENPSTAQQWSIVRTDTGYKIQSRCNSYYLDVNNGALKTGTNVQVWEGNNSAAQRFCFVPYGPSVGQTIDDGTYTIASAVDSSYGFDVQGYENTAYANGTNVQLWEIKDGNDTFDVKYLGNGYYSICESISGLSLDVNNDKSDEYLNVNKNVQMYTYSDVNNQKWIIRDTGNGYYNIISANSGYYVDLSGGIVEPRRNIAQYTYNNSDAQKWKFEAPVPVPDHSKLTADKTTAIAGETFTFTAEADNAANYMIKIDKDGEQLVTQSMPDGQLSLTFSEAGTYSAYVTASNRSGSVDSQRITFEVKTDITLYDSEKYTLPFSSDYTFKTNNSDVAVVSKSGVLTAIGVGKATISVIDEDANVIQLKVNVLSEAIVGDCNKDGVFNESDVVLFQDWLLAVPNTHLEDWKAADLCEDDKLDVFDLCLMKRMIVETN